LGKQTELLDLQALDSSLDRLRKERASIAERAEADELCREIEKLQSVLCALEEELHESEREQTRLENELSTIGDKIGREEKKLYGGGVVNPKELASIQQEVGSLNKHRDDIETELLETMETVEQRREKADQVRDRKTATQERVDEKERVFAEKAAALDDQIARVSKDRQATAERVPADLLAVYEKIREQKGGLAAGELLAAEGICGACRVELPAQELERMIGSETLNRCPQCRRILVERG